MAALVRLCVRGDDADALHFDAVKRGALFAAAAIGGRNGSDFLQDIVAGYQVAEGGVLMVQKAGIPVADEELATSRIRAGGAGHGNHAANVGFIVKFSFDFVAGVAGSGHAAGTFFGVGATTLDHETFDDPVESSAIVEFFVGEFFEVFDRFGCDIRPEVEGHFAEGGFDDGLFVRSAHGKAASKPVEFIQGKSNSGFHFGVWPLVNWVFSDARCLISTTMQLLRF
jgi:hypothetical protein